MLTLGALAIGYLIFVGCSVCRAIGGYEAAQEECERDASWWRGLDEERADEPTPLADAAE